MLKSRSHPEPANPGDQGRAHFKAGVATVFAAASIAFVVVLLQDPGAPSAREPTASEAAPPQSIQGAIEDLTFGPPVGELPSLRKAPAVAEEYRGVDVEDVPLDRVQSGSNG